MRKFFAAVSIAVLVVGGSTACATKKFVRTSVGDVNDKVDSMGKSIEETQERTRQNEGKIAVVDQKADQASQSARQANSAAGAARGAAADARSVADAAASKADAVDRASKRLVYEVVLSDDEGRFAFGKTALPGEAKAKIDELITGLKADPKGAWFEIEGYTDNLGGKKLNERIGLERAEAVKRYLYEQHQIPLHKMSVISYGEEKPIAPNTTRTGRAQNRRVVIKVLV